MISYLDEARKKQNKKNESGFDEHQYLSEDANETLKQLIHMTKQTNLIALDKTIAIIKSATPTYDNPYVSYASAAARIGSIAERSVRAVHAVGLTLPAHQRAVL